MLEFDQLMIREPDLREFIYEGVPVPTNKLEHDRVMAVAEYLLDLADMVATQQRHDQLDPTDYQTWRTAFNGY